MWRFITLVTFIRSENIFKVRLFYQYRFTLCCFVIYSTRRLVLYLTSCHFVLVFFSSFSIAITSLGEERANISAFRTFVRCVLGLICRVSLPLSVSEGLRFVIVALPGLFSYYFLLLPFLKGVKSNKNAAYSVFKSRHFFQKEFDEQASKQESVKLSPSLKWWKIYHVYPPN